MNENLNLVEILKDCPKGTKLYSSVFGRVEFDYIDIRANYPIVIRLKVLDVRECLTTEGMLFTEYDGECILFPSREQRDWSKFKPTCEFKDGDIVATNSGSRVFILQRPKSDVQGICHVGYNFETNKFFYSRDIFDRLATEEEKQKLFKAIKDNGYEWNAETKTLKKLVKPKFKVGDKLVNRVNMYMGDLSHQCVISEITNDKYILNDGGYIHFKNQDIWALATDKKQRFDPKTLHPFDRVLVRLTKDCIWNATFFSHYDKEVNWGCYPCVTTSCKSYDKCIPYNDETKHLLGTSEEAQEYYRYWED